MVSYSRGAFPKVKGIVPESASCPSQKRSNCARISSHLSMSLPSLSFLLSSIPQRVDSPCHSADIDKSSAGATAPAELFAGGGEQKQLALHERLRIFPAAGTIGAESEVYEYEALFQAADVFLV